jgi:cryptochrome 1
VGGIRGPSQQFPESVVHTQVLAYVWAPKEEGQFQPGRASRWWLHKSLSALEKQVEARGSFICYREGLCAVDQLLEICREVSASVVFFNNVYDPLSLVRDHEVKRQLSSAGIVARSFNGELLFEPWAVLDEDGQPFTTFEGFWGKYVFAPHLTRNGFAAALHMSRR